MVRMVLILGSLCAGSYLLMTYLESFPGWKVTRRLANIPYILFAVFAFSSCLISIFIFSLGWIKERRYSLVSEGIGQNKLVYFIFANLMTGIVNLTFFSHLAND